MSSSTVVHSARLVSGFDTVPDSWVRFEGDRVAARGIGDAWRESLTPETVVTDAAGRLLVPGFIDLHCHGAGGASVEDGEQAIETALAVHNAHGTTRSVLSLVTAGVEPLTAGLETIARVTARDPRVLGAHLEGPFLDTEFRGAHDPALLRPADAAPRHPVALESHPRVGNGVEPADESCGVDDGGRGHSATITS